MPGTTVVVPTVLGIFLQSVYTLPIDSFSDGPCHAPPIIDLDELDFELALHFAVEPGYVPMASKMNYYSMAEILQGEVPHDMKMLEGSLCLKLTTGLFENVLTGFNGEKRELACELNGIGSVSCVNKDRPSRNTTVYVVWSNNDKLLSVSCLSNGQAGWSVLSSTPVVHNDIKEIILQKIQEFGFNPKNAMQISYENCQEEI